MIIVKCNNSELRLCFQRKYIGIEGEIIVNVAEMICLLFE